MSSETPPSSEAQLPAQAAAPPATAPGGEGTPPSHDQPPPPGFHNSPRRVALELLVLVGVVVALGVGVTWGGGALASSLTPFLSTGVDRSLGAAAARQVELGQRECPNPAAQEYVEALAQPLLEAAGELPFEFRFRVVDDPSVNAFALPGGFVTVQRGLLEAAETGEEVAGVLAHEIQHALLRHGTRRMLRQLGARSLLWLVTGGSDLHGLASSVGYLTELGYDRDQESEADREGLELMVRAGIDPRGLATFFERLEGKGVTPPELLSTHPDPGNRARAVREAAQEVTVTRKLPPPSSAPCH